MRYNLRSEYSLSILFYSFYPSISVICMHIIYYFDLFNAIYSLLFHSLGGAMSRHTVTLKMELLVCRLTAECMSAQLNSTGIGPYTIRMHDMLDSLTQHVQHLDHAQVQVGEGRGDRTVRPRWIRRYSET